MPFFSKSKLAILPFSNAPTLTSQKRPLTVLTAIGDTAQTPARDLRIAYGGIGIACSTYSRLRTCMDAFTILRGAARN